MPKINFHNIDCMDFLSKCKDNEYDLAIVISKYYLYICVKYII